MQNPEYLNEATKAVILTMNYYNPSNNFYVVINTIFEYQGTSELPLITKDNFAYRSTDLQSGINVALLTLDLVRLGILIFFNIIVILQTIKDARKAKKCNII